MDIQISTGPPSPVHLHVGVAVGEGVNLDLRIVEASTRVVEYSTTLSKGNWINPRSISTNAF